MPKRTIIVVIAFVLALHPGVGSAQEEPKAERPPGYVGPSIGHPRPTETSPDYVPIPDRWRLGLPDWNRYERPLSDAPFKPGRWWDPYNQNILKGDFPIYGQNVFMNLSAISDTLFEARRIPIGSGASSARPDSADNFGNPEQFFLNQNFILSLSIFKGDTAFKPRDWEFRATGVFNFNFLQARERGVVNADVREGIARNEDHVTLQELFVEYHLGDLTPNYDFASVRAGIQQFVSDFRGFIFSDENLGVRLFGNLGSNRQQFNALYFRPFEKDTNSGLNRLGDTRGQHIAILNYFYQDFLVPGYTLQFSAHYLHDSGGSHTDENGFVTRPAVTGIVFTEANPQVHTLDTVYLGWTGDGHIGPLNVNHAYYHVLGRDTFNNLAGRPLDINADMAALELSMDFDWFRPKATFFWASGDGKPLDGRGRGFDSILDNPNFAGGGFSYYVRQGIPLPTSSLELKGRNSLLPALRSSKIEGQPNYVNPGIFVFGLGAELELTPKVRLLLEANKLRFHKPEALQTVLFQDKIRSDLGWDLSAGIRWRPLLIDNMIINIGGATLIGGDGLKDIYQKEKFNFGPNGLEKTSNSRNIILYSGFVSFTFTY
ncbi:MAG: hypothetical protein DMD78_05775 [Candidatus Rokuibacteriota bacterium]|nr:MAG: hypothetical protein DMD78_05775 [Candidatus Rokubacteria bacterium]